MGAVQAVNGDGKLAWTRVTVLRSFHPQLPDHPFLRMTTAAGQVCTCRAQHEHSVDQSFCQDTTVCHSPGLHADLHRIEQPRPCAGML